MAFIERTGKGRVEEKRWDCVRVGRCEGDIEAGVKVCRVFGKVNVVDLDQDDRRCT